jgi:hypothetical protein
VLPAYDFPWHPGLQPAEKVIELNKMLKNYAAKKQHCLLRLFFCNESCNNAVVATRKNLFIEDQH